MDQSSRWLFCSYLGTNPFHILGEMLINQHVAKGNCQLLLCGEARVCFYIFLGLNILVQSVDLVQCLQDDAIPTLSLF